MTKFKIADSDTLKYLSPSNADKCWRELVKAQQRSHVFNPELYPPESPKLASSRDSVYKSTYSVPKRELLKVMRASQEIPPAGRPSFHKEIRRPGLEQLARNAEYQSLIAEHMRHECSRHQADHE